MPHFTVRNDSEKLCNAPAIGQGWKYTLWEETDLKINGDSAMWQFKMFQEPRRGIQQLVESKETALVRFWMLNEQRGEGIWDQEHGQSLVGMAVEWLWLKKGAPRGRSRQREWKGRLGPLSKTSKESGLYGIDGGVVRHWCMLDVQLCKQKLGQRKETLETGMPVRRLWL